MPFLDSSAPEIELHGWDAHELAWHGPTALDLRLDGCRGILARLRPLAGSWHGKLQAQIADGFKLSFCASLHDLDDSGLALLDLHGSPGGPLHAMLIVPSQRRARVRPELAFEFVSYLRFLEGPASAGAEMALHDYIERTLSAADPAHSLVFAVESSRVDPEMQPALCGQAERVAAAMLAWMQERDGSDAPRLCAVQPR